MRKKSRRTGSVYCCEVINARPGRAALAVPPPPNGYRHRPRGVWASHPHPTPKPASRTALCSLNISTAYGHRGVCVCLGPSKSNIPPDLCARGSLCTPRQTGIFSGVCSHSRKNSQMGITLPRGTGWMSFIYNNVRSCLLLLYSWGVLPPRGVEL